MNYDTKNDHKFYFLTAYRNDTINDVVSDLVDPFLFIFYTNLCWWPFRKVFNILVFLKDELIKNIKKPTLMYLLSLNGHFL